MTGSLARLVFPALRWRRESFAHERPKIDAALAAGVGGFIVFGGTRAAVATLTRELVEQAGRPLLVGADLERGPAQQVQGLSELPPPAARAVSILGRSCPKLSRRQRSAGKTRRASDPVTPA